MRLGILSDTHGLLRERVRELLAGSDLILHAGDVGDVEILERLGEIAPVEAVRGNVDVSGAAARLPAVLTGTLEGGVRWGMTHRREDVPASWLGAMQLVVFGHSHRPETERRGACLLLNPGACGRRRFNLPLTVARVRVGAGEELVPEILYIE